MTAPESSHAERLIETFASLADTLVAGYDLVDLLQTLVERCADLLDVDAADILLANESGELEVIAATSEVSRLVETVQVRAQAGPCIQSYLTGEAVLVPNIDESPTEWQQFEQCACDGGFGAAYSIPMRLRTTRIGALSLMRARVGSLEAQDLRTAQALADVATIGILHERTLREAASVRDQLASALDSRIVIEQAKGFLAHTHDVSVEEAFKLLRSYARSNRRGLSEVAAEVVTRTLTI